MQYFPKYGQGIYISAVLKECMELILGTEHLDLLPLIEELTLMC